MGKNNSGKLLRLHRDKSSYRKSYSNIFLILVWVGAIFVLSGNISAAEAPTLPASSTNDTIAKTVLDASSPVTKPKFDLASLTKSASAPTVTLTTSAQPTVDTKNQPAPEIKIEIASAEYIPPAPTVSIRYTSSSSGNNFPYGYCTWYVANKRPVVWGGNAGAWYYQAQAAGYKVGSTPAPGAIMVSYEGSAAGHVAYVESVNPNGSFNVSEMDYFAFGGGFGLVDYRTVTPGTVYIVGFIY